MNKKNFLCKAFVLIMLVATANFASSSTVSAKGLTWPTGQVLPSFSSPAPKLDLIDVTSNKKYEAEGTKFTHPTGRADGDGWLAQCGMDEVGYMLDGIHLTDIPEGINTANFEMKVDNNTANDDIQVRCEVYDNTTGTILATKIVTRKEFTQASNYQNFPVTYNNTITGHQIDFKVYWYGRTYLKINDVYNDSKVRQEENVTFTTLKGLVNKTQPRIYSFNNDEEGKYNWLNSLDLGYNDVSDNWSLITKYRKSISGIVIYDDKQMDTMNLATTIASFKGGIVAPPSLVAKLTSAPYNLPIINDLRGQFTDKLSVYQYMYTNYWSKVTHKVLMGLNPQTFFGNVRDYAAAVGTATIWLDPKVAAEKTLLDKFLSGMPAGSGIYMGWWPDEGVGVTEASIYGVSTCASDWSENLTVFGGTSRTVNVKPIPNKPALDNKIYVSMILSDGDNLQYMEHKFKTLWDSSKRGQVPIGWTVSPVMLDAMPGVLNYIYKTATKNDCLVSGPSGVGYTYPNYWTNQSYLDSFVKLSDNYMNRAGLKVATIWNTILGGINDNVGNSFAKNAPSLLGLTSMNAGGQVSVYNNILPAQRLNATYCYSEATMKMEIGNAIAGWDGTSPRFVSIQEEPWDVTYDNFVNVVDSFKGNSNVVFVRPDNYFELIRENSNLPVDPSTVLKTWEAENQSYAASPFTHDVGRIDGDSWSANQLQDNAGFMIKGPNETKLPDGSLSATFKIQVDNNTTNNDVVATIDVKDNTNGKILVTRDITRQQFSGANTWQDFSLAFTNPKGGHKLEFRVNYKKVCKVSVDKITITTNIRKYEAEGTVLAHDVGRVDGSAWSANTVQDKEGFMVKGLYEKLPVGDKKVTFAMKVDKDIKNIKCNQNIATIDVRDSITGLTVASKTITGKEFTKANNYQNFSLSFNNAVYNHPLEYRVYYYKVSKLSVDKITVN